MSPSINDIPDELVHNIVSRIKNRETLHNLCLTSRRLCRITLPHLYQKFSHRLFQRPQRLHTFLRTILAHPELAAAIVEIELRDPEKCADYWDMASWRLWAERNYVPIIEAADHLAMLTAGVSLQLNSQSHVDYLVRSEEAQVALLLVLAQSVVHLHIENPSTAIDTPRFSADHLLMAILHPQIKSGAVLQNLHTLVATSPRLEGGQGGFRLSAIAPFFRLPSLHTFKGCVCHEPEDNFFTGFDCPERSSTVTMLTLEHSAICPLALKFMILACARLEHFACDWAGTAVGWVEVNFPLLCQALWEHRSSLKTLSLDTRKHFDSWPEHENGLVPALGSLQKFSSLEVLDVPASALMGWPEDGFDGGYTELADVLPPAIRELRINQVAPRVYERLSLLAKVCADKFPELRRIVLCEIPEHMDLAPLEADLRKNFYEAGAEVDFEIEYLGELSHFVSL